MTASVSEEYAYRVGQVRTGACRKLRLLVILEDRNVILSAPGRFNAATTVHGSRFSSDPHHPLIFSSSETVLMS